MRSDGAKKKNKKRQKKVLLNCGKVVGLQPETTRVAEGKTVGRPCSLKVLEWQKRKGKSFSFFICGEQKGLYICTRFGRQSDRTKTRIDKFIDIL
ncbi:hypothetical protein SB49_09155 [Sediminicola sp. YIK13]|nr:hypothetical protein SB49_01605 [Sediminicola sp. YIK13]ALM07946.1 hypothetical protein SB49_09155 [Sediminicola sp. YIK13]